MKRPETNRDTTVLFIYGTLKVGHCRAPMLVRQLFLGAARTCPIYRLFNCGAYPGLVRAGKDDGISVEGELWEVDPRCLARLDSEEGVDIGLYERTSVNVEGHDSPIEAYFYLPDTTTLADCGGCWSLEFERRAQGG